MKRLRIVIILNVVFFLWNLPTANAQFSEAGVPEFKVPVEAPDFRLKELTGDEVSLKEMKGKVVVLNFFGTR